MTSKVSKGTSHAAAHAASAIPRAYRLVGWTRAVVLIMMVLSSAWTVFLAVLNYAPNGVANYMMNTTRFDDGEFWQLAEISPPIMAGSVIGLGVVAAVYLYLVVLILSPPRTKMKRKGLTKDQKRDGQKVGTQLTKPLGTTARSILHDAAEFRRQLMSEHGRYKKVWNLIMEIPELIFQTVMLHSLLSNGIAPSIISPYVAMMAVNCVYCFYHITVAWKKHAFHEMIGDALMDVVFAIVFPAVTLLHTMDSFRGGLKWILLREQYFPAEPFERRSRLYVDPRQINSFLLAFDCLRITDKTDLIVTVGFNLLTCLRWRRIVITLQRAHQLSRRRIHAPEATAVHSIVPTQPELIRHGPTHSVVLSPVDPPDGRKGSIDSPKQPATEVKEPRVAGMVVVPHRVIPAYVGFLFLAFGGLTVLYTSMAVSASSAACAALPHCSLHAYQWFPGAPDMACPCLMYIHGQLITKSRDGSDPEDATRELSMAAEAGTLRTIQLMNVGVQGKLPAHVKACTELRELILLNTDLGVLPSDWVWTFRKLQLLYITSGTDTDGLTSIPPQFFMTTPSLRALSLQNQRYLTDLPSFQGLDWLQTLLISNTYELPALPALNATPRLRTLALIRNRWLTSLPDLAPVRTSLARMFVRSCPLCCSGFLASGACNTTETNCLPYFPEFREHSCYPSDEDREADPSLVIGSARFPLVSDDSRSVLQPFLHSLTVCDPNLPPEIPHKRGLPNSCEGVWYRQCPQGICYAAPLETPVCVNDSAAIAMRTAFIAAGDPCDPTEETWLGCL